MCHEEDFKTYLNLFAIERKFEKQKQNEEDLPNFKLDRLFRFSRSENILDGAQTKEPPNTAKNTNCDCLKSFVNCRRIEHSIEI